MKNNRRDILTNLKNVHVEKHTPICDADPDLGFEIRTGPFNGISTYFLPSGFQSLIVNSIQFIDSTSKLSYEISKGKKV
jgi:hypothetical protein